MLALRFRFIFIHLICALFFLKNGSSCNYEQLNLNNIPSLSEKDLECTIKNIKFRAISAYHLCEMYVQRDNTLAAFSYALHTLLTSPHTAEGFLCLSKIYIIMERHERALFYAQMALNRQKTVAVYETTREVGNYLKDFIQETRPPRLSCEHRNEGIVKHWEKELCSHLDRQSESLFDIHFSIAHKIPSIFTGPSVFGYESFLAHVENLCSPASANRPQAHRHELFQLSLANKSPDDITLQSKLRWSMARTVVLYSFVETSVVFGENLIGLSDVLNRIGIPHRVATVVHSDYDFVAVEPMGPATGVFRFYIPWNFEKNPALVDMAIHKTGFGLYDKCGRDEARYSHEYMLRATQRWESIPANMRKWDKELSKYTSIGNSNPDYHISNPKLIRALFPLRHMQFASAELKFRDLYRAKYGPSSTKSAFDAARPIDIFFFGNTNPHRELVKEAILDMAQTFDLVVEFVMDYNSDYFMSGLDIPLSRAKVVLSLANSPWPPLENMSWSEAFPECEPGQDVLPTGAAANLHRIRSLLARGKVVISERSGSPIDETELQDVVIFADTADLPAVILTLLHNFTHRELLERRGLEYMIDDHTSTRLPSGEPSAVSNLVEALSELVATQWPHDVVVNPHAVLTSINDLCASVDVNDASLSVLQWAECQCLKLYPFQDSLSENEVRNEERTSRASLRASLSTTRPLLPFNMVRAFNASSPCHIRTTGEILVGYIIRRMWPAAAFNEVGKFSGRFLQIGCERNYADLLPDNFRLHNACIDLALSPTSGGGYMQPPYRHSTFPYIFSRMEDARSDLQRHLNMPPLFNVISLSLTYLSAEQDFDTIQTAFQMFANNGAILLIHDMRPSYPHESLSFDDIGHQASVGDAGIYYRGASLEMIYILRRIESADTALVDFDGGVLVCVARRNPLPINPNVQMRSDATLTNIDLILPVLSLHELDYWLANPEATLRYLDSSHFIYKR